MEKKEITFGIDVDEVLRHLLSRMDGGAADGKSMHMA